MAEQIVVNISKAPYAITLPSGRPLAVLPGYAVQGNHFVKFVTAGVFVPLAGIPAGFKILGVSSPLGADGVRSDSVSSTGFNNAPKSRAGNRTVPATAASALAAAGRPATNEAIAASMADVPGMADTATDRYDGLDVPQWKERIRGISDTTLAQQMKLGSLKDLARFLGIESADLLQTKADLIAAVRVRVRG